MSFSIQNAECGDGNAGTGVYAHWRLRCVWGAKAFACAAAKGAAQLPPGKCYSALTAAGCTGSTLCGFRLRRLPALTRRCDIPVYGIVNSAPAKGCVWPVVAPAEARVRAGAVLCGVGGKSPSIAHRIAHRLKQIRTIERLSRCAVRFYWNVLRSVHACRAYLLECLAFGSRLSLFLCQEKRDGLRYLAFLFRVGRDRH